MGWNGLKNRELLQKMKENGFDVLIAVDKNLPYQQNEDKLTVGIVILDVMKTFLPTYSLWFQNY